MTLIELLVAMSVLAIFTIGAAKMITMITRNTDTARQHYQAINLAKDRVERARTLPFSTIEELTEGAPGTRIDNMGYTDQYGLFQRQTAINTVTNGLKEITVSVWLLNRKTHRFDGIPQTLQSYIADMLTPVD